MNLYKMLDANGRSCHGGDLQWSLPVKNADGSWTPGEWMPAIEGDLVPCENGYHLCREHDLVDWLHEAIYVAEYRGEMTNIVSKVVVRECRLRWRCEAWNERTARLFAVWCARRALARVSDPDPRSVAACDTAERYANGEATDEELTAARYAAEAARYAAWSAANAAEAARSAARSAARYAARYAAEAAAWAAEAAARYAARYAAWAAAWAAADAAIRAAERAAQTAKLLEMLGGAL